MELEFRAVDVDATGEAWSRAFTGLWPAYRRWWLRESVQARPSYMEGRRAIAKHMPEMLALYDEVCELAGGGDQEARFLSCWCPPPYLAGCSQAIWPGDTPLLARNYDYNPNAFEAIVMRTAWQSRTVLGSSDGMWGLLDGMNEAGLSVSLTFGGRRVVGDGFGVPLILRYVLQTCDSAAQAGGALARIPTHMSYNVTAVDANRRFVTVYVGPDRKAVVTHAAVATNHQERVEWSGHARFTASVERERFLLQRLSLHREPAQRFIEAFLKPPLYSTAFGEGFGTLYTAVYQPLSRTMQLHWPGASWTLPLEGALAGSRRIAYPDVV